MGGGLSEPRDAILSLIMGLLQHPDQLEQIGNDHEVFNIAFKEGARRISPIGMYPRRVTQDTILGDTQLNAGGQIALCIGAANRS